jgi:hypothetical protein
MKLYLVTVEGYYDRYGSEIYSIGIFDSIDKAKEAGVKAEVKVKDIYPHSEIAINKFLHGHCFKITEFDLNTVYPVRKSDDKFYADIYTDKYLGGYVE